MLVGIYILVLVHLGGIFCCRLFFLFSFYGIICMFFCCIFSLACPSGIVSQSFFVTAGGGSVLCERGVSFIICIGVFILLLTRLFASD